MWRSCTLQKLHTLVWAVRGGQWKNTTRVTPRVTSDCASPPPPPLCACNPFPPHGPAVSTSSLHTCRRTDGALSIQRQDCGEHTHIHMLLQSLIHEELTETERGDLNWLICVCKSDFMASYISNILCMVSGFCLLSVSSRHTPHIETPALLSCHSVETAGLTGHLELGQRFKHQLCVRAEMSLNIKFQPRKHRNFMSDFFKSNKTKSLDHVFSLLSPPSALFLKRFMKHKPRMSQSPFCCNNIH